MNKHFDDMIERFKQRIDFDAALRSEVPGQLVFASWPDMLTAPQIAAGGWTVASDITEKAAGGAQRTWALRKGDAAIKVLVFVSSSGAEAARRHLLEDAAATMMPEVPYVRAQTAVGTLAISAAYPNPTTDAFMWVFRNVCAKVSKEDSTVALLPVARWLQELLARSLVSADSAQLRALPALTVSSHRAQIGEAIDIGVQSNPAGAASRYVLSMDFDRAAIDKSSFPGPRAQLKGMVSGKTAVTVYLIDRVTLVSAATRLDLDIFPAKDP